MPFIIGQDLGSQQDPSAAAIVDQSNQLNPTRPGETETVYWVRGLKLWALHTDYFDVARGICDVARSPALRNPMIAFDATGGLSYWDIIKRMDPPGGLKPIWISGGNTITEREDGRVNVGKIELLRALVTMFAAGRLHIGESALADTLKKQLASLTYRITKAINEKIDVPRDASGHGDLAMAVALAVWVGENTVIGWDGSLGMPGTMAEGKSVMTQARGVFTTDPNTQAWTDPASLQQHVYYDPAGQPLPVDREGPNRSGYVPPWGPDW